MHLIADAILGVMAFLSLFGGLWLSAILGLVVFVSIMSALHVYEDKFDQFDKLSLGGLASSMVLTTPTLFMDIPQLEGWSFNLARFFLALIAVRRFAVPVVWSYFGNKRQRAQIVASAARSGLRDNLADRL